MRLAGVGLGLAVVLGGSLPAGAQDPIVDSARKEGRFMWYTSMNIPDSQPLLDAFMKKYPFIKAQVWRGASRKGLHKNPTENRGGKGFFCVGGLRAAGAGRPQTKHVAPPCGPSPAQ